MGDRQRKIRFKSILLWTAVVLSVWAIYGLCDALFLHHWQIERSEERVRKSIVSNYKKRKSDFDKLIAYARTLGPVREIEFPDTGKFSSHLSSDSFDMEVRSFNLNDYIMEDPPVLKFELSGDGLAKINFIDTIFETYHWSWEFEGSADHPYFKKYIDYLGLSASQLDSVRKLVGDANCEAIRIYDDKSIGLRYDGVFVCNYEYFIAGDKYWVPENYDELEKGIFWGLNRQPMFCGSMMYEK